MRTRSDVRVWSLSYSPSVTMPLNFTLAGACGMHDRGMVPVLTKVSASCRTRSSAQVFSDYSVPLLYQSDTPLLELRCSL